MTANDIVTAARECVGTPFAHQGRVVGVGIDCAGVALYALSSLGVDVLDVRGYGRTPNKGHLLDAMNAQPMLMRVHSIADRLAGDILLMRFLGEPQHVAVFTGHGIIHAYEAVGVCCEHDTCQKWISRIVRVYRVRGLA